MREWSRDKVSVTVSKYLLHCFHALNPLVTNGLSHRYHLDESIFIFRGIRSIVFFSFLFHFSMKIMSANRIAPDDGTPRFAASYLGLFCLPISPIKRTSGLYG